MRALSCSSEDSHTGSYNIQGHVTLQCIHKTIRSMMDLVYLRRAMAQRHTAHRVLLSLPLQPFEHVAVDDQHKIYEASLSYLKQVGMPSSLLVSTLVGTSPLSSAICAISPLQNARGWLRQGSKYARQCIQPQVYDNTYFGGCSSLYKYTATPEAFSSHAFPQAQSVISWITRGNPEFTEYGFVNRLKSLQCRCRFRLGKVHHS